MTKKFVPKHHWVLHKEGKRNRYTCRVCLRWIICPGKPKAYGNLLRPCVPSKKLKKYSALDVEGFLNELLDKLCPKHGKPLDRGHAIVEYAKFVIDLGLVTGKARDSNNSK